MPPPYNLPDYHALIRGIRAIDRAGGGSTVARLVTADWLEEHIAGRWPAFIRGQCEGIASPAPGLLRASVPDGFHREGYQWWCDYTTGDVGVRYAGSYMVGIVKGFIDSLHCPLAWWLAHGPDVCRRHPVREVVIVDGVTYAGRRWFLANGMRHVPQFSPHLTGAKRHSTGHYSWETEGDARGGVNAAALLWAEADRTPAG